MSLVKRLLFVALASCGPSQHFGVASDPQWVAETSSFMPAVAGKTSFVDPYRETAAKILAAARGNRDAFTKLQYLTDRIGHRLAGSKELDEAIAWAEGAMKTDGHDARTEPVMVPNWQRGAEDASIIAPVARPLKIIGLGGTVPTPKGGITAPVVVVRSFEELDARASEVKGKLVLYDVAMPAWTEAKGSGYGDVVRFRGRGASAAAKHGAVGVLMRSVTAHSLRTPHTGAMGYADGVAKIPAAAVTVEDSMLIAPVTVKLSLDNKTLPDAKSANVIGELRGKDKPDEVVVIGAHIDSWDVGQGANDDGAGCVIMMQALTTLRKLGLQPRRTIRVVLFTNEENGLRGAKAYAEQHDSEMSKTVFAVEADSGSFAPRGFGIEAKPEVTGKIVAKVSEIASLLEPIKATKVAASHGGADIGPMVPKGVPTAGLDVDGRTYFDTHHTEADTLDKVNPSELARCVGVMAAMAYLIADAPERLDRAR
jgi:Zn-dependent M28 family amino/carboxypeptidase